MRLVKRVSLFGLALAAGMAWAPALPACAVGAGRGPWAEVVQLAHARLAEGEVVLRVEDTIAGALQAPTRGVTTAPEPPATRPAGPLRSSPQANEPPHRPDAQERGNRPDGGPRPQREPQHQPRAQRNQDGFNRSDGEPRGPWHQPQQGDGGQEGRRSQQDQRERGPWHNDGGPGPQARPWRGGPRAEGRHDGGDFGPGPRGGFDRGGPGGPPPRDDRREGGPRWGQSDDRHYDRQDSRPDGRQRPYFSPDRSERSHHDFDGDARWQGGPQRRGDFGPTGPRPGWGRGRHGGDFGPGSRWDGPRGPRRFEPQFDRGPRRHPRAGWQYQPYQEPRGDFQQRPFGDDRSGRAGREGRDDRGFQPHRRFPQFDGGWRGSPQGSPSPEFPGPRQRGHFQSSPSAMPQFGPPEFLRRGEPDGREDRQPGPPGDGQRMRRPGPSRHEMAGPQRPDGEPQ